MIPQTISDIRIGDIFEFLPSEQITGEFTVESIRECDVTSCLAYDTCSIRYDLTEESSHGVLKHSNICLARSTNGIPIFSISIIKQPNLYLNQLVDSN